LKVTGSAKHRHSCAENVSAIAFGVGRVNDLHPRAQCAHGRKLLDGKTFNSDARWSAPACAAWWKARRSSYDIVTERGKQAAGNLQAA
jgi:hypothetical protein